MSIMQILMWVAAAIVFYRTLHPIATLDHNAWMGRRFEFSLLAISHALLCAGAVAAAIGFQVGSAMLLLGLAGVQIIDRRNRSR